jgi:hypothetical protein
VGLLDELCEKKVRARGNDAAAEKPGHASGKRALDELYEKKVRVRFNEAAVEEPGHASRKRAAWGMTLQKAMGSLPEHGEDHVRYPVGQVRAALIWLPIGSCSDGVVPEGIGCIFSSFVSDHSR